MSNIYIAARFLTQPITGVQRYGIELSKAIKKLNAEYELSFVAPKNVLHGNLTNLLDTKIVGNLTGQFWDQIELLRFLKKQNNPLVVNFSNTLPVFYKNKIVTVHDIIHLKYPVSYSYKNYYKIIFPLMIKNSKHIITVSEFSKNEISNYFKVGKDKISVVYNGISEKFRPIKGKSENYILGVSSVAYHKNFRNLIKVFLKIKMEDIKLYIVGGFNEKIFGKESGKILDEIEKNNDKIKFLGRVDDKYLVKLYSNAICFVYPSLYEGFGIPPLEAQACGCPIVISNIPVFKEVYGGSALYFNPLSIDDMVEKIVKIVKDEEFRQKLKEKGFINTKKYSWGSSAKQFFEVLKKINE